MKRKKIKGLAIVLLLAAGIAMYLEACKKDIVTPINNMPVQHDDIQGYSEEAQRVVGKIKKFKSQLADKEQVAKTGLYMPIDSVIWNVEALFNAEYAFPDRIYRETVKQELQFFVDVNANNEAPFATVAELYDEITESVRDAYSNDGIHYDKSLLAVVVDEGETVGNTVKINVLVISGMTDDNNEVKDPVAGPFGPGDCWYYGEYGGTCDDPSVMSDAAEIMEDTINYYYRYAQLPKEGFRDLIHGMFRLSLEGDEYLDGNGEPYIYFHNANGTPPVYLDQELLNYYYNRELEVLMHLVPDDPRFAGVMPTSPAFINVDIQGILGYVTNGSYMHHKNYVVYGSCDLIPATVFVARDLLE